MRPLYDLYVACCTEDGGVVHLVLWEDGSLTESERVLLPSPMYLSLRERRLHTLLLDPFQTGESGHTVVSLSDDGTLGAVDNIVRTGGGEACYLSPAEDAVYVANYQTGSVACLSSDGERLVRSHNGVLVDSKEAHPHYIAPSPDGNGWLCADLGLDCVMTYNNALEPLCVVQTPEGHGPRHLVASPDGRCVYSVNENGNTVTVFSYDSGRLTPLKTVEALPFDHPESYAAAIRLYDGRLYVSHRGDDSVTVFAANGESLSYQERIPCGGRWPRDFDLFGDFLVCTNEKSDSVTVLHQNGGAWTVCAAYALPRPLCVVGRAVT